MGLTIFVGVAGCGRTALASWVARREVAAGKRVLFVGEEEQWLGGVACECRNSGAFFYASGYGLAWSATREADTLIMDSDYYSNIEDLRRLADEGKNVFYFMQIRRQELPATTVRVGDTVLTHIADDVFTIDRDQLDRKILRLTQVKSRRGICDLPLTYTIGENFTITAEAE